MTLESLSFSSAAAGPADPFEAYRELYAGGADTARFGGRFHAKVHVHRFPRMLIFERRLHGVTHSRGPARVRRDGFDHVAVHLVLSGSFVGGALGSERTVAAGEIALFDTRQPQWSRYSDAHLISVSLARDQLEAALPGAKPFHGAVLPPAVGGLLGDFVTSMNRRASTLPFPNAERAAGAMAEVLALALCGRGEERGGAGPSDALAVLRRDRVEAFVANRLADPGLDASSVIGGVGLSRSSVYRLFEADGGLAHYIRRRRLAALRDALRRENESRSIASLAAAHGFVSESHCNRLFRDAFGRPPGQFRADAVRARRTRMDDAASTLRLRHWHSELY